MHTENTKEEKDWQLYIALLFWSILVIFSILREYRAETYPKLLQWIIIINNNTFATSSAMVSSMVFRFFAAQIRGDNPQESGLSRKWIAGTIVTTGVYIIIFIVDACIAHIATVIMLFLYTLVYVVLFFKYMRVKRI